MTQDNRLAIRNVPVPSDTPSFSSSSSTYTHSRELLNSFRWYRLIGLGAVCALTLEMYLYLYIYIPLHSSRLETKENPVEGERASSPWTLHAQTHTHTHRERGVAQRDWFQKELFMTRLAKGTRRRKRRRYELAARVINVIKSIWRATVVSYGGGAIPAVAYIILLSNANDPKTTLHAHLATRRKKTSVINPSRTPCLLFHQLSIVCVCVLLVERWKEKKKESKGASSFLFVSNERGGLVWIRNQAASSFLVAPKEPMGKETARAKKRRGGRRRRHGRGFQMKNLHYKRQRARKLPLLLPSLFAQVGVRSQKVRRPQGRKCKCRHHQEWPFNEKTPRLLLVLHL